MRKNTLILAVTMFLSVVHDASTINCYYCNSANNSACIDLMKLNDEVRSRIIPVVHCETAINIPNPMDFFCRKITQTIFHSHRDSEVRVTRGCGWVAHHKDCYKADNSDHLETVCQCFEDHCNSAESADPAATTVLFLTLAAILYFYR